MEIVNPPIRDVTVAEMLKALGDPPDDTTFRYYQTSVMGPNGWAIPGETLRLTVGQLRRDCLLFEDVKGNS